MSARQKINVAVVGAASLIGAAVMTALRQSKFPLGVLHRLDELRFVGAIETDADDMPEASIGDVADFNFDQCEIAFFCGQSEIARQFATDAARKAWVIDVSGAFRDRDDIPLVAADVNPQTLRAAAGHGLIAVPGSAAVALLTALAPLHARASLQRLDIATYHAVSGGGRAALEALARTTADRLNGRFRSAGKRAAAIAFNVVPQVDVIEADGISREERRIAQECRRVLEAPELAVNVTAVRVPVFYGHSFAVHAAFTRDINAMEASQTLAEAAGVSVQADPSLEYPTAAGATAGPDRVYVGRIRADLSRPRSLNLWVVADNVRKCAALNAVAIAHILVNGHG